MKKCKYCMTEIDSKAKLCPKCHREQGMPSWLKVIFVILGITILISIIGGGNFSDVEEKGGTTDNTKITEKFTLLDGYIGYAGDYDIGYYIEGYVQNNTDREYTYVQIIFNLYDSEGTLIGTAMDNINYLEANSKWKFKAISLTTGEETANIASYKLKEITGY